MIDIHCHIIPGIDDGAKNLDTSIEMLRIAEKDGIKKIIATPHFYRGRYENHYCDIKEKVLELNKEAKLRGINVEIFPGQEIFLDKYTIDYYKKGIIKGLNDSKYLLVETDMLKMPRDTLDIIYELKLLGAKPIIAHPERYEYIIENLTELNKFIEEGCALQLNAGSFLGIFGKKVKKTAEKIIKNGVGDFIASDAHSTGIRKPNLSNAYEIIEKLNFRKSEQLRENSINMHEKKEIMCRNCKIREKKRFFDILSR